jgi:glycosyltransferase involved in cell wall biosynthesis
VEHVERQVGSGSTPVGSDGVDSGCRAPRVLLVDTSLAGRTQPSHVWDEVIDYAAIVESSRWLRFSEQLSRLDFSLARRALREQRQFDVLVAGSEKVGIPLALMFPSRPLFCIVHQIASPAKRALLKTLRIPARWIRVGYQCSADREVLETYYGVPADRLIQFKAAPLEMFRPGSRVDGECVLSVGTSKRDYRTLFTALDGLPGVVTHLYASSRFLDPYHGAMPQSSAPRIELKAHVDNVAMPGIYESARFVVLPIMDTYQYSAGTTVALEAHAAGKAIVATNTPGMRDFVVNGVTGFLVPVGDAIAMKDAITRLWNDPRRAADMGLAGRAHVESAFNPAMVDARIRQAYVEACEEYRQSR